MAEASAPRRTPVTMLSGFLGAGKTTLLRYVLENTTEKIACIVNDVAAINVDAKLVRNDKNRGGTNTTADLTDTIELANGCACCNIQDELFASFEQVLALADKRGEPYTRIVLENSGVAEPQNIRDKFNEAAAEGHPLLERVELDTMVTLVDCGSFLKDWATRACLAQRPDLGEGGGLRPVVDLLVEQIECADFVILNKTDMLGEAQREELAAIVASLNPLATVIPCTQGKIPIERVFGSQVRSVVAHLNIEGQHRGAVAAAKSRRAQEEADAEAAKKKEEEEHHHHHHHHHHDHDHKHDHHHHHEHGKEEEGCQACKHEHGEHGEHKHHHHHHHHEEHSHADHDKHADCKACQEEEAGHVHSHADHDKHDDCKACAMEAEGAGHKHHHHHHHHKHERGETRAAQRFGIRNFVYSRRRPFHPQRLKEMVLKWLPVTVNAAIDGEAPEMGDSPIKTVMRSKGFMWLSSSHATAYYWSHAGQHFEIRDEGDWWAAVPPEDWPQDAAQREIILNDFDASTNLGDRRQEIVFIGVNMDEAKISAQLDGALLSEEEMGRYLERWGATPDPTNPEVEARRAAKGTSTAAAVEAPAVAAP
ncbi:hypothetical protein Agub_g483 [Astrephomene gubernaculifera]|uniref:CobW C-terminal domain-containing protein n=1 Tax=Astrephomene gubernaculifera TaxID=47775 RepID=A0AAD3DEE3_9CHLO|nr:hypothetical protein Agub_g483 [Astrephomene gubernaculifera]